jgi:hypothetical protein
MFPQRPEVLLVLEIDAACNSLSGHCARKVHYWFLYDGNKPQMIENKICEGTDCLNAALSSCVTSL